MKKLEHGRAEKPQELSRREFFRLGAAGTALVAGLQLGILTFPGTANAQVISIQGTRVSTERLPDTIANLERSSRRYQRGERVRDGVYTNMVNLSEYSMSGVVSLASGEDNNQFSILFPRERDRNPRRTGAGSWNVDITDLKTLVSQVSSQEVKRMKLLVAVTTDPQQSDAVITVYAIPLDQNGNIIGRYRDGYLAMGASYYPERGVVYGARSLLLEPGVPEPESVARR